MGRGLGLCELEVHTLSAYNPTLTLPLTPTQALALALALALTPTLTPTLTLTLLTLHYTSPQAFVPPLCDGCTAPPAAAEDRFIYLHGFDPAGRDLLTCHTPDAAACAERCRQFGPVPQNAALLQAIQVRVR